MFIPQQPYLPIGTLRDVLTYPGHKPIADATLREALVAARLPLLVGRLDDKQHRAQSLSTGERQRIAFARVFIQST